MERPLQASDADVAGLAWANDGSRVYLSSKRTLWSYEDGGTALEPVAENLPRGTCAIMMRADDLLVGIARKGPSDER